MGMRVSSRRMSDRKKGSRYSLYIIIHKMSSSSGSLFKKKEKE